MYIHEYHEYKMLLASNSLSLIRSARREAIRTFRSSSRLRINLIQTATTQNLSKKQMEVQEWNKSGHMLGGSGSCGERIYYYNYAFELPCVNSFHCRVS